MNSNSTAKTSSLFAKLVSSTQDMERVPAMQLFRDVDPVAAATLSKLVAPTIKPGVDQSKRLQPEQINFADYKTQSDQIAQRITDARTIYQSLPDLKVGVDIIVSSILSPKDMQTTELTYTLPDGLFPSEVQSALLEVLKEHYEQTYRIKPMLTRILTQCLGETGSYPVAVLPENAIDDVINGRRNIGTESLSESFNPTTMVPRARGILGPVVPTRPTERPQGIRFGMESFTCVETRELQNIDPEVRLSLEGAPIDTGVFVTDNTDVLKMPELYQKMRSGNVMARYNSPAVRFMPGNESIEVNSHDLQLMGKTHRRAEYAYSPLAVVRSQSQLKRMTVGEPLVVTHPSEAVIPVYVPGLESKHVGYFILLDPEGNPLHTSRETDYFNQLRARMTTNSSFASAMLAKVNANMNGFNWQTPDHINHAARVYGTMIERELMERMRNGALGRGVKIGAPEEVWRLMLARSLSQQQTQLLFIPVEFYTYFAFDYDDAGVGKSLLEDIKIICSQRSALQYANTMAGVRNATGRTKVDLKLDEADPDPYKTIDRVVHEIARTRQQSFPIGTNSPTMLVDYIQRAGYEIGISGHPGVPDVGIEFSEHSTNYTKPDTEIMDELRKLSIYGIGLTPENVDAALSPDFATSIVQNSIMMAKRTQHLQEVFIPQLEDHLRKYATNSAPLLEKLRKVLIDNIGAVIKHLDRQEQARAVLENRAADGQQANGQAKEEAPTELKVETAKANLIANSELWRFLSNFQVNLPQPNTVSLKNQLEAFKEYKEALELVVESYINDRVLNGDTMGDLSGQVEMIKNAVISYYLRRFLAENGIMTELNELLTVDEDGNPAVNIVTETDKMIESLNRSLGNLLKRIDEGKTENKDLLNNELENPPGGGASYSSDDSSSGSDDTGSGDDAGGDDMFGDLMGGGDAPGADFSSMDDAMAGDETPAEDAPAEGETPAE